MNQAKELNRNERTMKYQHTKDKTRTVWGKHYIFFGIFLLILMAFIFYMSSRPVDQSAEMSYRIDRWLCSLFVSDYGQLSEEQQLSIASGLDFWVRKTAHLTEYLILGSLLYFTSGLFHLRRKAKCITAFCAGMVYAALDEFHQYFVPGRGCELRDVIIDTVGIALGVAVAAAIAVYKSRRT